MAAKKKSGAKRGRKPAGESSVKDQVLSLFRKDADMELDAAAIIEALKADHPKVNEGSIRSSVAQLKSGGLLIQTRKDGRLSFMKLNPSPPAVGSVTKGRGRRAASGSVKEDRALLKEAQALLVRLAKMLDRNEGLVAQIEKFKAIF
jgi:hypothetical protein